MAAQALALEDGDSQAARIVLDHDRFGPLDLRLARTQNAAIQLSFANPGEELRVVLAESLALRQQIERGLSLMPTLPALPADRIERTERSEHMRNNTYGDGRQTEGRPGDDAWSNRGDGQRRDNRQPQGYRTWLQNRSLA